MILELIGFILIIAFVGWLGWWIQPKPMSISELCTEADIQYGSWPLDPRKQIEWAIYIVQRQGPPKTVHDVVQARVHMALCQLPQLLTPPDLIQVVHSLERAQRVFEGRRDELFEQGDYNATFDEEDALHIAQAIDIIRRTA